jgi:predicted RNA-binding protein with PUA-like domain
VTLEELRAEAAKPKSPLAGMLLLQRGSRLSVQPVAPAEWAHIMGMVEAKKKESKK